MPSRFGPVNAGGARPARASRTVSESPPPFTAVAAVTALALFAACAGPAPAPRPPPAPRLRVAASFDYAPFSRTTESGAYEGLDVVVMTRLAGDLGLELAWTRLAWPELTAATAAARFDVAVGGVTMRAERALVGRYTRPYAVTAAIPVVPRAQATRYPSLRALDRPAVRLGVNAGGHLQRVAQRRFPRAALRPIADNRIFAALEAEQVDAVVTDTAELYAYAQHSPRPLVALTPLTHDHKAYLLPAERGRLAARIDTWLRERESDGWLPAQRARFLGAAAALDAATAAREAVAALVRLRLDLMADVAGAKRAAGLPIEDRAQEARVRERVGAAVPSAPMRAAAVYAELIEMAKALQRAAPASGAPGPSLDVLRAALGRIDDVLCAELERLPAAPAAAWRETLETTLAGVAVAPAALDRLATALARPA